MRPSRKYDIINLLLIMITIMMLLLATNLFLLSKNVITASAKDETPLGDSKLEYEINEFKKNILIYMINKSIPILEIKNENHNMYTSLRKYLFDKIINFDYRNPRTYLGAQISMIKEVDKNINIVSKYNVDDEDDDTRDIYIRDKNINTYKKENINKNENTHNDIVVINQNADETFNQGDNEKNDNNNIQIVSTPAPTPKTITYDKSKPLIFIYHTHGTESYKPESIGNYHSLNRQFTVIKVGEELKKGLEGKGYKVIHNDTLHDYPSYQGSYNRSLQTLEKNLKEHSSLKIIFDLHRDGINNIDGLENYEAVRKDFITEINGEKVAKFSMVLGGANENINELKKFIYYIKAISDDHYPGLCSKVILKDYKYNQYKSDNYALLEIGSNANTIEEAINTAKYLTEVINIAIKGFAVTN